MPRVSPRDRSWRRRAAAPVSSIRRSAIGVRGPPFGSATSANCAPMRRAWAAAMAGVERPAARAAGMATSMAGCAEGDVAPQGARPSSSTATQMLAVDQVAEDRRRPPPAAARRRPGVTCASAEPVHDQRAARARCEPPRRRARSRRAPAGGISRGFSWRGRASAPPPAGSRRRRACAPRSAARRRCAFQSARAVAIARLR